MAEPFLGQISVVAFNFAPNGWALCNGQALPIAQNQALFSLLGTTYGGNGQTTFALPDFRGRVPIHFGQGPGLSNYSQGETGGGITVVGVGVPPHTHAAFGTSATASSGTPTDSLLPVQPSVAMYGSAADGSPIKFTDAVTDFRSKGESPHENRQPFLGLNFIIAIAGIFPSPI